MAKNTHLKRENETDREYERRLRMNATQKRYYISRRQKLIDTGEYEPIYQSKYVKA